MRVYVELARRAFRRYASYRAATVAGVFTNIVFGVLRASILLGLYRHRTTVGGFDATDALTYAWLTQGLIMVIYLWGWNELALRVRSGDVAVDLCRPVDFQGQLFAQDLGRATFHLGVRGTLPFLFGALVYHLRVPSDPFTYAAFAVCVALAVCVSFGLRFLANLTAFWLVDTRGVRMVYGLLVNFLSGFIIPVAYFPGWLRRLAAATPFPSMVEVPVEVFLGRRRGAALVGTLAAQAAWAVALLLVGRLVLRAAVRRLVVQGG